MHAYPRMRNTITMRIVLFFAAAYINLVESNDRSQNMILSEIQEEDSATQLR